MRPFLILFASCLVAGSAVAQQAAAPDPAALAAFQTKATLYSRLLLESRDLAIAMVDRIGLISEASSRKEEAYDPSWTTPMRAKIAALKARLEAAPAMAASDLAGLYPEGGATAEETTRLVESYPAVLRETQAAGATLIDRTEALGPAAQRGDPDAILGLAGAMFAGMSAATAAENLQLQLVASGYAPAHPQRALTQSSVASNLAMIEFFSLMNGQAEGRDINLLAAARRIRLHAEESRAAATSVEKLAIDMSDDSAAAAKADGLSLRAKDVAAFKTYSASAANEIAITDRLDEMAVSLAQDGISTHVETAWEDIEQLIERRFQLDARRHETLAQ